MSRTKGSTKYEVKARQLEALMYRSFGYSVTVIASKLGTTRRTVFNYLKDYPYILSNQEIMEELKEAEQEWRKIKLEQDKVNYKINQQWAKERKKDHQ